MAWKVIALEAASGTATIAPPIIKMVFLYSLSYGIVQVEAGVALGYNPQMLIAAKYGTNNSGRRRLMS